MRIQIFASDVSGNTTTSEGEDLYHIHKLIFIKHATCQTCELKLVVKFSEIDC